MQGGDVSYGVQSTSSGWSDSPQTASRWYNVSIAYQFYVDLYSLRLPIQQQVQPHHAYNRIYPPSSPTPSLSDPRRPETVIEEMAFINSLTHGTLLAASNTVYMNCLDSLAKKDQEIGLLKDRIFDLQYVFDFVTAYTLR